MDDTETQGSKISRRLKVHERKSKLTSTVWNGGVATRKWGCGHQGMVVWPPGNGTAERAGIMNSMGLVAKVTH